VTKILHISDLHFGRPMVAHRLNALEEHIHEERPAAVAVSGDLTQRCTSHEFERAARFLDSIRKTAPAIVVPGNHDVRWMWAIARSIGLFKRHRPGFKYERYRKHISHELNPSLEVPGAVIAGINTAHGISRGSLTRRIRDLGVIGHVPARGLEKARETFKRVPEGAARIVMIHHNPIRGATSRRHGLANTREALEAFADLGAELILCGHDHQEAIHYVETTDRGIIISTAGTISSRLRAGRSSSFNAVEVSREEIQITTFTWELFKGFVPTMNHNFRRHTVPHSA
jgi:3',5'-cyclic AMP phosphodiesterase CpdA